MFLIAGVGTLSHITITGQLYPRQHCAGERMLFQTRTRISWLHKQVLLWLHVALYLNIQIIHVHTSYSLN